MLYSENPEDWITQSFYQNTDSSAYTRASLLSSLDAYLNILSWKNTAPDKLTPPSETYNNIIGERLFELYGVQPELNALPWYGGTGQYLYDQARNFLFAAPEAWQQSPQYGSLPSYNEDPLWRNNAQYIQSFGSLIGDTSESFSNLLRDNGFFNQNDMRQMVWSPAMSYFAGKDLNEATKAGLMSVDVTADPNWRPTGYDQWMAQGDAAPKWINTTVKLEHYYRSITEFQQYFNQRIAEFERGYGIAVPGQKEIRAEEKKRIMDDFTYKYDTRKNPTLDKRRGASGGGVGPSVTQLSGAKKAGRVTSVTLLG
jgi:nuclear transport factor 2 (NTF2) superfamily protein